MAQILAAKLVGDMFNHGIYDLHIHLKRYPVLPDQPPRDRELMQAKDVMSRDLKTLYEKETVATLVQLLKRTRHHGFPVVALPGHGSTGGVEGRGGAEEGILGVILRDQILTLLAKRVFEPGPHAAASMGQLPRPANAVRPVPEPLTADDFMRPWFSSVNIDDLALTQDDLRCYVNLRCACQLPVAPGGGRPEHG